MTIRLQDTLTGEIRSLEPLEPGHVRIYTCGPTVYGPAHIGNFRSFLFADLLVRFLRYRGLRVTWVMNLTDIDDKIIRGAGRRGVDRGAREPLDRPVPGRRRALRHDPPDVLPRATHHIDEMVAMIARLEAKGHAYRTEDGSVFFRIARGPPTGGSRAWIPTQLRVGRAGRGRRVRQGRRPRLRALEGPQAGRAVVGHRDRARPPRLAHRVLRDEHAPPRRAFDIHTGGVDLVFPHHEDEIAQREAATGKPFVRTWLHCAHLRMGGEKMAKSTGNIARVADLLEARRLAARAPLRPDRRPLPGALDYRGVAGGGRSRHRAAGHAAGGPRRLREDAGGRPDAARSCWTGRGRRSRPPSTTISTYRRRWPPFSTWSAR